jgi:hypothetical protein
MVADAIKMIEERIADLAKKAGELKKKGTLAALLEAHIIFTAYDRLRILSHALDEAPFKEPHAAHRKSVVEYMQKVPRERNILGHQVLSPEGKPKAAVIDVSGKEVSLDDMRSLRKLLLNLRDDFRALHKALAT